MILAAELFGPTVIAIFLLVGITLCVASDILHERHERRSHHDDAWHLAKRDRRREAGRQ